MRPNIGDIYWSSEALSVVRPDNGGDFTYLPQQARVAFIMHVQGQDFIIAEIETQIGSEWHRTGEFTLNLDGEDCAEVIFPHPEGWLRAIRDMIDGGFGSSVIDGGWADRQEAAMLAGMSYGVEAYNEAIGSPIGEPNDDHHSW